MCVLSSALLIFIPFSIVAADAEFDAVAEAGRIYDKWWVELDIRIPQGTHPSYPKFAKKNGADTWRCKECHGWDYRGNAGAYSQGSHFTGIKGITNYAGADITKIVAILKDKRHRYDEMMQEGALKSVALFVAQGLMDMGKYIDAKSKQVNGNALRGKTLFADNCARCHDNDGRGMNFASGDEVEYIGTLASDNPWEALHKIRNGHPGAVMRMHRGGVWG